MTPEQQLCLLLKDPWTESRSGFAWRLVSGAALPLSCPQSFPPRTKAMRWFRNICRPLSSSISDLVPPHDSLVHRIRWGLFFRRISEFMHFGFGSAAGLLGKNSFPFAVWLFFWGQSTELFLLGLDSDNYLTMLSSLHLWWMLMRSFVCSLFSDEHGYAASVLPWTGMLYTLFSLRLLWNDVLCLYNF